VRNAGPWTPTVHRYLRYLQVAGIDWVPRPIDISLGADGEPVQERLSYVHGDVPGYPLPDWVWAEQVLVAGAQHLRRLHDASIGFGSDGAVWQAPAKIRPRSSATTTSRRTTWRSATGGSSAPSTSTSAHQAQDCGTSRTSRPGPLR